MAPGKLWRKNSLLHHLLRLVLPIASLALVILPAPTWAEEINALPGSLGRSASTPDNLLASTIEDIRASRPDSALSSVNRLIAMRPDFKLAYLIKGDLLLSKTRALPGFGGAQANSSSHSLDDLKDEARVRLLSYLDQPGPDKLPAQILQMAPGQKYALLADASRSRIYVFENVNGEPRLINDYYLSVGKNGVGKRNEGDKRSPLGVYTLNNELPKKQLTPFYGAGAFPLNYPNEWDALQGNEGHGIWLHGVPPDTYSRAPKTSEGCLVVTNPDWQELARYIRPDNTPLVITAHSEWLDRDDWLAKRQQFLDVLDSWRNDWQKLDADSFIAHYAPDYLNNLGKAWVAAKERNITQKEWIKVGLTDMSLFQYSSGNDNFAVINLTQHYSSDKLSDVSRKKIYLRLQNGQWRIAFEKTLQSAPSVAFKD
jgi:murein L,D-transpeptidase YafK